MWTLHRDVLDCYGYTGNALAKFFRKGILLDMAKIGKVSGWIELLDSVDRTTGGRLLNSLASSRFSRSCWESPLLP